MLQHPATVYFNGQFISKDKAAVSPDDRGFYFADGVYEVVKYYKGKPFYFQQHIERLQNNLHELKIDFPDVHKFEEICGALIYANQLKRKYSGVYIQITRGVAARTHRFPKGNVRPTVFANAFPMPSYISEMTHGVMVKTHEDIRWLRCNIKTIALLPNTLMFEEAAAQDAFECLLHRNGTITEATHSNVLAVKKGKVYTHPDGNLILPGITKMAVLRLCHDINLQVVEEPIKVDEINEYEEFFLTGTGCEVVPIVQIDGTKIGNGKPGPVTRILQEAFIKITYEDLSGEKLSLLQ